MSKLGTLSLSSRFGFKTDFNIWSINTSFNEVAAVYAFTKRKLNSRGSWDHDIYYIGRTDNLNARLNGHHKLALCIKQGANCICVHQDRQETSRVKKEVDLIDFYKPKFNELLK